MHALRAPWKPAIRVLFGVLTLSGCAESDVQVPATEVRDSAGIRIVVSARPESAELWTIDAEPSVAIGGNASDTMHALFQVTGAVRLDDGRIVITHGPAPMVRWYDQAGNYVQGTGRSGGGPGEFGSGEGAWISTVWALPGDSVGTWEHPARRMQVFDPVGRFIRAVVLDIPPATPQQSYPQMVDRIGNGFIVFLNPANRPRNIGEVWREDMTYMRYHADGVFAAELLRAPGYTQFTRMRRLPDGQEFTSNGRPPFSMIPVMTARGSAFVYGSGERYELAWHDTLGNVTMLVRKPEPGMAVTPELIERYKHAMMELAPDDPAARRQWQDDLDSAPYADSLPAYRRARFDRTGALWVNEYTLPDNDSTRWSVFGADGVWQADVLLPVAWQLFDIGADYILVLTRDELDVERVEQHRLHRGAMAHSP